MHLYSLRATLALLFAALCALAQSIPGPVVTPPPPPASVPYSYFAETGASGSPSASAAGLSSTTGFGVRIANSNAFWVTDVDTQFKTTGNISTLSTGGEYHVAISGSFEFLGFGAAGISVDTIQGSGPVAIGNFAGGFGLSYDLGSKLSKGKVSLPVVAKFRIQALTATIVTTNYSLMFRKTF